MTAPECTALLGTPQTCHDKAPGSDRARIPWARRGRGTAAIPQGVVV